MKYRKLASVLCLFALSLRPFTTAYCADAADKKPAASPSDPTTANGADAQLSEKAKKMFDEAERRRKDPAIRKNDATTYAEKFFGPILDGMELTAEGKRKALDAIIDRYMDRLDTLDYLNDNKIYTKSSRVSAMANASEKSDRALQETIGPKYYDKFKKALEAEYYVSSVATNEARLMETMGHPLTPSQRLELAIAKYETMNPEVNPDAKDLYRRPLNEMGLTDVDESLLTRMQGILDSNQLFALRNSLVQVQRAAHRN